MNWTDAAEKRLKEIPFFVRPAARKKIEKFAQDQGLSEIPSGILLFNTSSMLLA